MEDAAGPGDGRVVYDCAPWSAESRRLFGSLLEVKGLQHVWQGTSVSVHSEDEELASSLLDEVMATADPVIEPDEARLTYDVANWPSALQNEFTDQLTISEVPYEWDVEGNIVVRASDEELVDEVVAMLPDEDDAGISSDDGVAVHELLNELFMSADRLRTRPTDASATLAVVEGASTLERLATPFGFAAAEWNKVVSATQALRDAIEGGDEDLPSDKEVSELARASRDIIRRFI